MFVRPDDDDALAHLLRLDGRDDPGGGAAVDDHVIVGRGQAEDGNKRGGAGKQAGEQWS